LNAPLLLKKFIGIICRIINFSGKDLHSTYIFDGAERKFQVFLRVLKKKAKIDGLFDMGKGWMRGKATPKRRKSIMEAGDGEKSRLEG